MTKTAEQLSVLLGAAILPSVFERLGVTGSEQIEAFYRSAFYEKLRDPASGLWHLSAGALADLYTQEAECGSFEDPEEQS